MTVFTLAIDDSIFKPDEHALHLRTANTAAVSVDYIWLDDLPVAQFQDSYDTQGVHIGTEVIPVQRPPGHTPDRHGSPCA